MDTIWLGIIGQVNFPNFLNTAPQNLQNVTWLGLMPRKLISKAVTRFCMDLKDVLSIPSQFETKKLNRPNFIIPFDYNLLILVEVCAYIICPTTYIVKFLKFYGT